MLRYLQRQGIATRQARALALAGMLMVLLGACSALDGPPDPAIAPDNAVVGRSPEPQDVEDPLASFLEWVSNAPSGVSTAPSGVGWEDGYIRDGDSVSPFEPDHPAIANLDSSLLDAIQRAALNARDDGIELRISSGWRSAGYQAVLLDQAIQSYGSEEIARRFVNTPEQSTHVQGAALDVAPTDAMSWLSQYGSNYGLCQTYANEMWHYELMIEPGGVCPSPVADASVTDEAGGESGRADTPHDRRARPLEPELARP